MKILGKGWQYTVYDKGNNRVIEKYHNIFLSYFQIIRNQYTYPNFSLFKIPKVSREMRLKAETSIQFLKKTNIEASLLGNPVFINDVDYEQDKIISIETFLNDVSFEEAKRVIDLFVDFQKKLLSLHFIDKSFNICKNFGISNDGNIVLLDLGELFFEESKIKEQIKNRAWTKPYVVSYIPSNELQQYFIEEMNKNLTLEIIV